MTTATRAHRKPATPRRPTVRSAVRFIATRPPAQLSLGITTEGEPTIDERIHFAKTTSANYEDLAEKASNPQRRKTMLTRAAEWNEKAVALILTRNRIAACNNP